MHHAQSLVGSMSSIGGFLDRPLSVIEANRVEAMLRIDATNYLYSACVSIGDALQAADRSLFTWATVKLYYSAFYLLRSLLALSGQALLYNNEKPYTLNIHTGNAPVRLVVRGGTHGAVIDYFTRSFPKSSFVTQEIDNAKPLVWLKRRREEANYTSGRFDEPICPRHFSGIIRSGVRRATSFYINDITYLYAFDPDHAILALPIEVLKLVLSHQNLDISANTGGDTQRFLRGLYADKSGPMTDLLSLLKV
jgi:hypothetical protein